MIIKPSKLSFHDEMDDFIELEKNVQKSKRDFYIHDLSPSPFDDGLMYGLVTQVSKVLISKLPYSVQHKILFDKPLDKRKTFVKILYMYSITMRSDITTEEAFYKARLKPTYAIITGMTDTQRVYNSFTQDTIRYVMTMYNFNEKQLMRLYDSKQLDITRKPEFIHTPFEFDIPDPRSYAISLIESTVGHNSYHKCYEIPLSFEGYELIRANTQIHIYKEDKGESTSIYDIAKSIQTTKSDNPVIVKKTTDLLKRNIAVKNLLVDMVKSSIRSMFGEFTLIYDTVSGHSVKRIITPFTTPNLFVFEEYMLEVELDFLKYCERITEKFGDVRIMLNVNDIEHVTTCIFKDIKPVETIKVRMSKQDCINDYLFEVTNKGQLEEFKMIHELDRVDFMSHNIDNNRIYINYN